MVLHLKILFTFYQQADYYTTGIFIWGPWASLVAQSLKNLPAMQETAFNARDLGSIPGLGRSPGEGNGNDNPL